jgi:dienelactone hydrolase
MKTLKRWWWLLPLLLLVAVGVFVAWATVVPAPMPEALAALRSDGQVQVETDPWLVFRPTGEDPTTGLILYPGARVDPRAYAPAARALAARGYLVAIVPMPLHLAILAPNRATEVMAAYPEVKQWAIGGHSLGGAMAAQFVQQNPDAVQGLALWASYPAANNDLSGRDIAVTSIYGTRDGLATQDKIAASRPLLPSSTQWVPIEGGNHAQFGWYGRQPGDNEATLSREEQQAQIVAGTLDLLSRIGQRNPTEPAPESP